jgi:flagellar biosynthesis protein FlhF
MARVLARVKSEMGPDAVILSTQTVRENGQCLCEIMAAVETDDAASPATGRDKVVTIPTAAAKAPAPKSRTKTHKAAQPEPEIMAPAPSGDDWRREWEEIRGHMMALIKPGLDFDRLEPRQRLAMQYLEREGVDDAVILTLFKSLAENGERTVLTALSRMVAIKPLPSAQWAQRIHILAGPSGAGKTTAVLRLALARKRLSPGAPVTVATLWDAASGTSLLRRYAELSGITFRSVSSPEEFRELCAHLGQTGWAFAEMPSLRAEETMDGRLRALGMAGHPAVAVHLALSPVCATAQLRAYAARYKAAAPGSIVWTKLDEACNFGALINVAHAVGLPVSALSHGPELTRNLSMATANEVWKLIFKHQLPGEPAMESQAAPGRVKPAQAAKSAA